MSQDLEKTYHIWNKLLSLVIGFFLVTIGGVWLYQNRPALNDPRAKAGNSYKQWLLSKISNQDVPEEFKSSIKTSNGKDISELMKSTDWQKRIDEMGAASKQISGGFNKSNQFQPATPVFRPPPAPAMPRFGR